MLQRILYIIKVYVVFVLAFVLAKPAFMVYQTNAQPFIFRDVWQVIRHGLSLDLSTALYFILLPYLVVMVSAWWPSRKVLGSILKIYYAIAALVLSLAFVADTSLYEFWGFKLDASVLQFLDGTGHATDSVSTGFVVVRFVCFLAVAALLFFVLSRIRKPFLATRSLAPHFSPLSSSCSSSPYLLSAFVAAPAYRPPMWGRFISRRINSSIIRL